MSEATSEPTEWCLTCGVDVSSLLVREDHFTHRLASRPPGGWRMCSCVWCQAVVAQMTQRGSCPACLGAMPAHQMGQPLQEAHRRHTEARDV